jgi:hypothetical protein
MLTDVRAGEVMGGESGSSGPGLRGKKEFTLKYVKTGEGKGKESGSTSPRSRGKEASDTNPTAGGRA